MVPWRFTSDVAGVPLVIENAARDPYAMRFP